MVHKTLSLLTSLIILTGLTIPAFGQEQEKEVIPEADPEIPAQLSNALDQHGSLDTWKGFHKVEFDLKNSPMGKKSPVGGQFTVDLHERKIRVENENYQAAFNGEKAWIKPGMKAMGVPPRFFTMANFYFFGMPFVLADEGADVDYGKMESYKGDVYNVLNVTYEKDEGDSPKDDYKVYLDPKTGQLKLIHFVVTYPAMKGDKDKSELPRKAVLYKEWQKVQELVVPKKVAIGKWQDEKIVGKKTFTFENVKFSKEAPEAALFEMPADAALDQSHMKSSR